MTLAPSDLSILGTIAGLMIPADAGLRMPGADDPLILADIARSVGRDLPLLREALKSFSAGQKTDKDINDWYRSGGAAGRGPGAPDPQRLLPRRPRAAGAGPRGARALPQGLRGRARRLVAARGGQAPPGLLAG